MVPKLLMRSALVMPACVHQSQRYVPWDWDVNFQLFSTVQLGRACQALIVNLVQSIRSITDQLPEENFLRQFLPGRQKSPSSPLLVHYLRHHKGEKLHALQTRAGRDCVWLTLCNKAAQELLKRDKTLSNWPPEIRVLRSRKIRKKEAHRWEHWTASISPSVATENFPLISRNE